MIDSYRNIDSHLFRCVRVSIKPLLRSCLARPSGQLLRSVRPPHGAMQRIVVSLTAVLSISIAKAFNVVPWGLQPVEALAEHESPEVVPKFAEGLVRGLSGKVSFDWQKKA